MLAVAFAARQKAVTTESGCGPCKTGCKTTGGSSTGSSCSTGPSIKSYTDLKTTLDSPLATRSDVSAGMIALATTLERQLIKAEFREKLISIDPTNAALVDAVNKSLEEQISILRRYGHAIGNSSGEINPPKSALSELPELNRLASVQHTATKNIITPNDAELIAGIATKRTFADGDPEYTKLVSRLEALPEETREKLCDALEQIGEPAFTCLENLLFDTLGTADTLMNITVYKTEAAIDPTVQDQAQLLKDLTSLPQDKAQILLEAAADVYKYTLNVASFSFPDIALMSQKSAGYSIAISTTTTEHLNNNPLEFTKSAELALAGAKETKIYEKLRPVDRKLYGTLRANILSAQQVVEVLELAASTPDRGTEYVQRIDQINTDFGILIDSSIKNTHI